MSQLMSLYDYLGRAAGPRLGLSVAEYAGRKRAKVGIREVSNPKYKGPINLYEESFLKEYFGDAEQQAVIKADKEAYEQKKKSRTQKV